MGLDLTILTGHKLDKGLIDFRDQVLSKLSYSYTDDILRNYLKEEIRADFFTEWGLNSWSYSLMGLSSLEEAIKTDNVLNFDGPWGISIRVGSKSWQIDLPIRWQAFLQMVTIQNSVRNLVDRMNSEIGGKDLIYIPDNATKTSSYADLVCYDKSIDEIILAMNEEVGPPCSIQDLAERINRNVDFDGYFIQNSEIGA